MEFNILYPLIFYGLPVTQPQFNVVENISLKHKNEDLLLNRTKKVRDVSTWRGLLSWRWRLIDPVQERGEPGVDPRVARLGTALAPGDDSYLRVSVILSQN